jgi:hypothetical protein
MASGESLADSLSLEVLPASRKAGSTTWEAEEEVVEAADAIEAERAWEEEDRGAMLLACYRRCGEGDERAAGPARRSHQRDGGSSSTRQRKRVDDRKDEGSRLQGGVHFCGYLIWEVVVEHYAPVQPERRPQRTLVARSVGVSTPSTD